ncbi:Na+/H+ antiporter NhaC family protein [Clostridium sp.]|uniref:Na+/H+ antiporter NhaC family protein n=1 Tax=Clostridium sp. TaxID=1506 RepID=UPI003D6CB6EC
MDLIIAFFVTFALLIISVFKGIFLAYPLIAGLILFIIVATKRGNNIKEVFYMAFIGGKKSLIIINIFILIGAITSIWMACGTVPTIVYYSVKLIRPNLFILSAFLTSCFVSFLIGTSLGTTGTIGIALMVVAKGGNANLAATTGAIISGAYFGDRCSPMSSSASLVSYLTKTDIYKNITNMFKTCLVPFSLSIVFYAIVSRIYPLHSSANSINNEIINAFHINIIVMLPALIILILSAFRVNVKKSMLVSIIISYLLCIFIQHETLLNCIKFMIFGYSTEKSSPLYTIIKGGGIISMLKASLVIFVGSAISGVIEESKMLHNIEAITLRATSRYGVFTNLIITSIFTAAVGCSQSVAVMLTHMLNKKAYEKNGLANSCLAIDLENTAIMISALIPWNIALLAPIIILGTNATCIPFLFYIYMVPITNLISIGFNSNKKSNSTNVEINITS